MKLVCLTIFIPILAYLVALWRPPGRSIKGEETHKMAQPSYLVFKENSWFIATIEKQMEKIENFQAWCLLSKDYGASH